MKLIPIAQTSRVEQVAARLRKFVEDGHLAAGDRLPSELQLVTNLKVSRTVLREAIGRLETIGLLRVKRGLGTFVADTASLSTATQLIRSALAISTHELIKVAELRRCIETHCIRRAAELATDADIADLDEHYRSMQVVSADLSARMQADFQFHLRIIAISGNEVLSNVMRVIQDFIFAAMVQTLEQPGLPPAPHDLHAEILEAIRSRDPQRAEKAGAAHMDLIDARLRFVAFQNGERHALF